MKKSGKSHVALGGDGYGRKDSQSIGSHKKKFSGPQDSEAQLLWFFYGQVQGVSAPQAADGFLGAYYTSHHPTALSDFNAQFLMTKVLSSRELNFISFSAFSKHSSSLMLFMVAFSSGY